MKTLSTTPHENPRALHAFSAKGSSALNKYYVISNPKHLNSLRYMCTQKQNHH